MNSFINFKTNSKKLQFGAKKCKKMHVGHIKEDFKCQDQFVDSWTEVEVTNDVTGEVHLKDVCNGEQIMEQKCEEIGMSPQYFNSANLEKQVDNIYLT